MISVLYLTIVQILSVSIIIFNRLVVIEAANPFSCAHGGNPNPKNATAAGLSVNKTFSPTLTRLFDAPFLKTTNVNGNYCICPGEPFVSSKTIPAGFQGWTGVQCLTRFEVCPNGDLVCYNGGKCVAEQLPYKVSQVNGFTYYYYYNDTSDNYNNNNTRWFCDCRPENLEDQSNIDYAGVSCEYPATTYCGAQSLNRLIDDGVADVNDGTWFCTNDGVCNEKQTYVRIIALRSHTVQLTFIHFQHLFFYFVFHSPLLS